MTINMSWRRINTAQEALELLEQAVAQRGPDYRYVNEDEADARPGFCAYFHKTTGKPGCIVGVALSLAGWTDDELIACNSEGNVIAVAMRYPGRLSQAAVDVFIVAQRVQDGAGGQNRGTWGEALDAARKRVAE